jgi:hypothetical protein
MPFCEYRPDRVGGPIHILNVFVNESIDRSSGRRVRDRLGENMAVGPCGISVGPAAHAVWVDDGGVGGARGRLESVGFGDLPDPFVARQDSEVMTTRAIVRTPDMPLSDWMSISGAALPPGGRADTRLGTSLLCGMTNVRVGLWWDSGIEDGGREGERFPTVPQRIAQLIARTFRTQALLLAEFTGRFPGPWRRYWHLSDGGYSDDLGVYELIRRRVPIIICVDATCDAGGTLAALANAIRKVRVDFAADIEFLSQAELDRIVAHRAVGTLDEVRFSTSPRSRKHAAIARVRYRGTLAQSVFLYVKATMTGDEPDDVVEYSRQHRLFPHQSVFDQFLDEAEWESYRALGRHCADPLCSSNGIEWLVDVWNALTG